MSGILSPTGQQTPSSVGKVDAHELHASAGLERSPSSVGSSQDNDHDHELDFHDHDDLNGDHPDDIKDLPAPPQKRKGGRKPIYATSEERKQRNRQAQAAFRERRTEYIKQLEATIKRHEENLSGLQSSQRTALDECLMLRYKNSLLERILVEKGIDVQMELRAHNNHNSPPFGPTRAANGPNSIGSGPQGIQRVANARFARRPPSMSARPEQIQTDASGITRSPLAQAVAGSHAASPMILARSPNFLPQGGPISPSFGPTQPGQQPRQQPQIRPQPHHQAARPAFAQTAMGSTQSNGSGSSTMSSQRDQYSFVSPFQNHYEQLDQEYDAQTNFEDEENQAFPTASFSAPPLPPQLHPQQQQQHQSQPNIPPISPANPNQAQSSMPPPDAVSAGHLPGIPAQFDGYDPMLDADPFGLSASMHFPTPFTFETQR